MSGVNCEQCDTRALNQAGAVRAGLIVSLCVLLAACSGGRKGAQCTGERYEDLRPPVQLKVPEDLDQPVSTESYKIPEQAGVGRTDNAPCTDYPPRLARGPAVETPSVAPAPARPPADVERLAAPAPEPSGPLADAAIADQVRELVAAWASAWSLRDFNAYLAFYSAQFDPPGDLSREVWQQARAQRMNEGAQAIVLVDTVRVSGDGQRAEAVFLQKFEFEGINSDVVKRLIVREEQGTWRILSDEVIEVR